MMKRRGMVWAQATGNRFTSAGLTLALMLLGLNLGAQSAIAQSSSIQPLGNEAGTQIAEAQAELTDKPDHGLTNDLTNELEDELENLGETLEKNLRVQIDTDAIERAARPVLRGSLQTILDVAPALSRQAVTLGEWYLGQLGERALEELENAQETLEDLEDKL